MTIDIATCSKNEDLQRECIGAMLEENSYMLLEVLNELLWIVETRPVTPETIQRLWDGSAEPSKVDDYRILLGRFRDGFIKDLKAFIESEEMLLRDV